MISLFCNNRCDSYSSSNEHFHHQSNSNDNYRKYRDIGYTVLWYSSNPKLFFLLAVQSYYDSKDMVGKKKFFLVNSKYTGSFLVCMFVSGNSQKTFYRQTVIWENIIRVKHVIMKLLFFPLQEPKPREYNKECV